MRIRPGRVLLLLTSLIAAMYAAAVLWLISQETRLVFQAGSAPGATRPSFPYEQVDVARSDGARQHAWIMKHADAASRPWVLYLHGNASTIAGRANVAHYRELRALGLNIFAPEYRGYGGLDGVPSERSLGIDARAAYAHLRNALHIPAERIVIYGWSLGSAVAVDLAADLPAGAVILEGALASVVAIGERQYPFFPVRLIMRNPFEAIAKVGRIRAPMLFLHSPEDTVIPIAEGRRLFDAAPKPKTFVEVRGGHIYANEVDSTTFFGAIRKFLGDMGIAGEEVEGGAIGSKGSEGSMHAPRRFGSLPLRFEVAALESDPDVDTVARGRGYTLFLSGDEATLALQAPVGSSARSVCMMFAGASPSAVAVHEQPLAGTTNYLLGADKSKWRTGVRGYGRVRYPARSTRLQYPTGTGTSSGHDDLSCLNLP